MSSKAFNITLVVIVGGAGVVALSALHLENARLRRHVAEQRQQVQRVGEIREDTRRTQQLLTAAGTGDADAARAIHADLLRTREEVATLERKASLAYVNRAKQSAVDAEATASNRDPEKGVMRLEYFKNAGRATPSAAFQTLVWAATQGHEAELIRVVGMTPEARAAAEALIARLPPPERAQWSAERVAGKFLTALLNEVAVLQIVGATFIEDGTRAMLEVRLPQPSNREATQSIPMQRLAGGDWQMVIAEGQIERVRKKIHGEEGAPVSK